MLNLHTNNKLISVAACKTKYSEETVHTQKLKKKKKKDNENYDMYSISYVWQRSILMLILIMKTNFPRALAEWQVQYHKHRVMLA